MQDGSNLIVIPFFAGFMMWSLGQCSHGNHQAYTIPLSFYTVTHFLIDCYVLQFMQVCRHCNIILVRASHVIYLTIHRGNAPANQDTRACMYHNTGIMSVIEQFLCSGGIISLIGPSLPSVSSQPAIHVLC